MTGFGGGFGILNRSGTEAKSRHLKKMIIWLESSLNRDFYAKGEKSETSPNKAHSIMMTPRVLFASVLK